MTDLNFVETGMGLVAAGVEEAVESVVVDTVDVAVCEVC
jgi:hypothetical protein